MSKRPGNGKGLSPQQEHFVAAYLADPALNVNAAMRVAGYGPGYIKGHRHKILAKPAIAAAVADAMAKRAARIEITQDDVLRKLWALANADPNEIVEVRRVCCAGCYPDEPYDQTREIVGDCAQCRGEGYAVTHLHDSRDLSPAALMLYAGAKTTKDGIEVKLRDPMAALIKVGEHLGMFVKRQEITLPQGGGVLAVPMPIDPAQWANIAEAQQRALTAGTPLQVERGE